MNRLVIIGNGFDICCGLPSTYKEFINSYMKEAFSKYKDYESTEEIHGKAFYDDELMQLKFGTYEHSSDQIFKYIGNEIENENFLNGGDTRYHNKEVQLGGVDRNEKLFVMIKSSLLAHTLLNINWSSIESQYFKLLTNCINDNYGQHTAKRLNNDLALLKNKLLEYLKNQLENFKLERETKELINRLCSSIIKPIPNKSIIEEKRNEKIQGKIENLLVLNFNYTELYKKMSLPESTIHVNIHGTLEDVNEVVFGYGDESNSKYIELEQSEVDEYISHMKSQYYLTNEDFQLLRDFIYNEIYEVSIIGHSMGLSDRVLLKEIFENQNCVSIRPFHRGSKSDFRRKSLALTRHYKNKSEMRRKVIHDENAVLNR